MVIRAPRRAPAPGVAPCRHRGHEFERLALLSAADRPIVPAGPLHHPLESLAERLQLAGRGRRTLQHYGPPLIGMLQLSHWSAMIGLLGWCGRSPAAPRLRRDIDSMRAARRPWSPGQHLAGALGVERLLLLAHDPPPPRSASWVALAVALIRDPSSRPRLISRSGSLPPRGTARSGRRPPSR
jgi:hypothetical protein